MSALPPDPLQEELDRFVAFGTLLDRQTRRYLAAYLRARLRPGSPLPPDLDDTYYRYFSQSLGRIFDETGLASLLEDRPALSQQVAGDLLTWMRQAFQRVQEQNPMAEEQQRLRAATVMPLRAVVARYPVMLDYLGHQYEPAVFEAGFYREKLRACLQGRAYDDLPAGDRDRFERLFHDLLARWDALLQARLLEWQLSRLEDERERFQASLEARVSEYQRLFRLISPFESYVGKYWDLSRQMWQDATFDILQRYQELLAREDAVRELADLLGRLREAEIVLEEETYESVIVRQQWEEDRAQKSEIDGTHHSDDLNALLSSEASLLGDEATETLFLQKYADKGLLTFRYEDRQLVESPDQFTEVHQRVKQRQKGPFIVCVDTSDSMSGRPEQIAKVLCFGILKMAAREHRRAYLINFSTGIQTLDLHHLSRSLDDIAAFLQMSFHAGTDISLALYEVLRQIETEAYRDADVLVISDFIMYRIEGDILERMREQQQRGTQFHSLILHQDPHAEVIDRFDTNWVYDPEEPHLIRELAGALRVLGR